MVNGLIKLQGLSFVPGLLRSTSADKYEKEDIAASSACRLARTRQSSGLVHAARAQAMESSQLLSDVLCILSAT